MILAAGFGTRLLPYTRLRPKPLFPILNQPLLLLTIRRLQQAGCDHIVVNCHHLREQIVQALHGLPGVVVQVETSILGTGGGLRRAFELFRDEPVLVTNGDIYHTVDYRHLCQRHAGSGAVVTMAMHDYPRFNSVTVRDGRITGFDDTNSGEELAFTGLHVLEPKVLVQIPAAGESCIIDLYRRLLQQKQPISALRVDDCFWTDMGTVEDYLALHAGLLTGKIPAWPELEKAVETPILIADKDKGREDLRFGDWASIGDAEIGANVSLERSVVWDGACIAEGTTIRDQLVAR